MRSKNVHKYKDEFLAVGLKIGYLRRQQGITQEELADMAGISSGFLGQLEAPNISVGFSMGTLFAIAEALQVPPSKLLEFD